jgi:cation transport ATPase
LKGNNIIAPSAAFACEGKIDSTTVKVDGLVCDFCARALESTFKKREEIGHVMIDLDKHTLMLHFKDGKTIDHKEIEKLVKDSGYTVAGFEEDHKKCG